MAAEPPESCPDCKGTLQAARLVASAPRPDSSGEQVDLRYITARFDRTGVVKAYRCDGCSRIFLYG